MKDPFLGGEGGIILAERGITQPGFNQPPATFPYTTFHLHRAAAPRLPFLHYSINRSQIYKIRSIQNTKNLLSLLQRRADIFCFVFNKNFYCLSHSIFAFPSEDSVKITNVKEEKTQIHKLTWKSTNVYIFLYFTLLLYYNLTFSFPLPKDNNKQTNKKVQQIS